MSLFTAPSHLRHIAAFLIIILGGFFPATSFGADATATLSGSSLTFATAPGDLTFALTLSGVDQSTTSTQGLVANDATGSGTGWNITATSTTFTTTGSKTLPTTAVTVDNAPSIACATGSTCTTATNNVSFPYTLPAAGTAPTATKLYNAAANTGMGRQTITPTWKLSVPSSTFAGTYTSTWTISLVSGP